jgi:hypothetical protein
LVKDDGVGSLPPISNKSNPWLNGDGLNGEYGKDEMMEFDEEEEEVFQNLYRLMKGLHQEANM